MNIPKEQLKRIVDLLNSDVFAVTFRLETGNKLETAEQAVDALFDGVVTLEDMFFCRLDESFRHATQEVNDTWEDNMEMFAPENYLPSEKTLPEGGAWIKVRHETGYQLHFAKVSNRKRRFAEEIKKVSQTLNKEMEKVREFNCSMDKAEALHKKMDILFVYHEIDIPLYEVRYQRTKTKVEYLNPFQYEICSDEDLQMILDAVRKKTFGVKMRNLYTSVNKDQIFYLRSRGISEQEAMIMANLKQCYFDVDIMGMNEVFNESFRLVKA